MNWARFSVPPSTLQIISGTGFIGQKTQPTVSKHWRKRFPKDQASIPLGPPHCADNNTTYKQYEKKNTKYTQINTTKSTLCTVKYTQCDKTVRTAHLVCLWLCTTVVYNAAQKSSDNLLSYLQTNTIAQMLSIRRVTLSAKILFIRSVATSISGYMNKATVQY